MISRSDIRHAVAISPIILLLTGIFPSCAPVAPLTTPPETYKGPKAERPVFQPGEYWIYERGNSTRVKTTALMPNIAFPLWIGRTWTYEGEALPMGQSPETSKSFRTPTRIDCQAAAFKQVSVKAGMFGAFECECQCTVLSSAYVPSCGQWTIWYAPEVKNVVRIKTESTATSMELIEFKSSQPAPKTKRAA